MIVLMITISGLLLEANAMENVTIASLDTIAATITSSPNASRPEYRVYLVRQTLDKDLSDVILKAATTDDDKSDSSSGTGGGSRADDKKYQNNSTVQIYIIAVIGVSPAVIGGIMWALKNLKRKCIRDKASKRSKVKKNTSDGNTPNPFLINDIPINQLTYKLVERAEKSLNTGSGGSIDSSAVWYNSYKPSYLVKSRRVYSLEVSRKNLDMIEILGEGNFGQVWKARATQIKNNNKSQTVAIKTNKINTDEKDAEDLLKELDIMLQLGNHPNVVKLLGCCTETMPYFLIMEFVSNGKLLSFLRRHRTDKTYYNNNNNSDNYNSMNSSGYKTDSGDKNLSANDLVLFAYQISKGMEFISSHGIIHRDLAARNILIDDRKTCKVADFGLSRSIRDKDGDQYEQKTGGQMPVRWMSPESLSMGVFSAKSDVWAYAVLLWEIVTLGSTPYIGLSAQEVIKYVTEGHIVDRPQHCSDRFYELMSMCFRYDCDNRLSFTDIRVKLSEMIELQCGYVDLQHFDHSLYYNLNTSSGEKI
ncbi:unnamed protein product [Medioppia subpectinata]|uniref:Protein kinase domain-containing protein n=1 Tax=Medioppia subpectinata TaxID=1979941 RepID=A0A7R9KWX3_9ACAR|nr:unnamed protein product [Medioppia subpectinata]CAG2110074.1 unnamed protein product [Medioppia subpectinata]